MVDEMQLYAQIEPMAEPKTFRGNSVERFAINAKPYQNVYSSNHFLEHFFGDRNDKTDQVVKSTSLSSSDQTNVEIDEDELYENFDTYLIINNDNDEIVRCEKNMHQVENEDQSKLGNEDKSHPQSKLEIKNETQDVNESENDYNTEIHAKQIFEMEIEMDYGNKSEIDSKHEEEIETFSKTDSFEPEIELAIENSLNTQIDKQSGEDSGEKFDPQFNDTYRRANENEQENKNISSKLLDFVSSKSNTASDDTNILGTTSNESTNENKADLVNKARTEFPLLGVDSSLIEPNALSSTSCDQSVNSDSNSPRPWLCIVDTQTLAQQKKVQTSFPITTAVSMWLNQLQKEKTPEPIFRLPDRFFAPTTKYRKQDSQTSHSSSSIDLTEDNTSISSDKFLINDDEEEDIMNFWESPTLMTPQIPTTPLVYNSLYGSSINYKNLLSNKNELLCNNIIDYDATDINRKNVMPQNIEECGYIQNAEATSTEKNDINEKCYRPPREVCCTIM